MDRISGLKTSNFLSDLTDRSYSPFSKKLWSVSGTELLRVSREFSDFSVSFWKNFWKAKDWYLNLFLLSISLFMFVWFIRLPKTELWQRLKLYFSNNEKSFETSIDMSVLGKPIIHALLTFISGSVLYWGLNEIGFVTTKAKPLFVRIIVGTSVFVLILNLAKIKFQTGKVLFYDIMCRNGKATYNRNLFVSVFALFVLDRIFSSAFQLGDAKTRLLMAQAIFSCLPFSLILFKFANVKNWAINGMKNDTVDKARFKGIIDKINVNIDKTAVSDSNKSF